MLCWITLTPGIKCVSKFTLKSNSSLHLKIHIIMNITFYCNIYILEQKTN